MSEESKVKEDLLKDPEFMRGLNIMHAMNPKGEVVFNDGDLTIENMSPFPAGCNPYRHDAYHMGTLVGEINIMYSSSLGNKYMILIFPNGRRVKIGYSPELMDNGKDDG